MPISDERVRLWDSRQVRRSLLAVMALVLSCMLAATCAAGQQQDARPTAQPPAVSKAGDAAATKPGEFYDKALDLHFNYPIEMQIVDANAAMELGHQEIYGASGENDPEHQDAKRCVRPLLNVTLPEEKAPQRPATLGGIENSQADAQARKPQPIFAMIAMMALVRDCLPKKVRKNDNDALASIAKSFVAQDGIQLMSDPIWYEIGQQKIHMISGVGVPVANGQPTPAPMIIMSMATQWRGHLLAWVFTANDTGIFNEITKSLVQFGNGPWSPMFGPNIGPQGSGTPITILPK